MNFGKADISLGVRYRVGGHTNIFIQHCRDMSRELNLIKISILRLKEFRSELNVICCNVRL